MSHSQKRGQVGIGTLIVFIAMVLVAAVAAGVLVNTAGYLQSTSEQTGKQAATTTTNRLVEISTVGSVDSGEITELEMTVALGSGSSDINLEDVTIEWVSPPEGSESLVAYQDGNSSAGPIESGRPAFSWETLRDEDSSIKEDTTLNSQVDRAILTIDLTQSADGLAPLTQADWAEITLSTRAGGDTSLVIETPDSLTKKSSVNL